MTAAEPGPDRDRYCGGKKRQGEGNCTRPAGWGTDHPRIGRCKLHGGKTTSHNVAAQQEMARRAVRTYGLPLDVNPVDALLDEVRWTAGHVAWLRERVQEIEQAALVWGVTEQVDKDSGEFSGSDKTEAAKPNVWLVLYQQERKHLVDVCKTAIQVGIEERRVKLAEAQGQMLADVIRAILAELALTPEQQARAPEIASRHLRLVAGLAV